jgi:hypothetical protein
MFQFLIPAAAALIGSSMSSRAAKSAAQTSSAAADRAAELQRESSREALDLQRRMYEEGIARQQPFLQTGTEMFNRLAALQRGGPDATQNFLQMDPGYQFRLSEGMKALDRQAAARGGLISGSALKAAQRFGQDLGSQEYSAAYGRLAGLADVGPRAAGVMSSLGERYGQQAGNLLSGTATNIGNIMMGQGQTAANAALARGSAYAGGLNQLGYLAGRYYGQPQYQAPAPVESRDIYPSGGGGGGYYPDFTGPY